MRPSLALAATWLLGSAAQAQVTPVSAFVGDYSEGWETAITGGGTPCQAVDTIGDVCSGAVLASSGWSYTCMLNAYSGTLFAGSAAGASTYTFTTPITQFGGYFSTNAGTGFTADFEFFDPAGVYLGSSLANPLANCGWGWLGFTVAGQQIGSVVVTGSTGGGFVMMDDMEFIEQVIPDFDGDGFLVEDGDCNDQDATVYPGATELCDGIDNDCDGALSPDELDQDGDGAVGCEDCDDTDSSISPLATERCDGIDNDCDGVIDPAEIDDDGDGLAECEGDCNDAEATVAPGKVEICDNFDNDCDGDRPNDELDLDGDGYLACDDDCNDADETVYPGAEEIPDDGIDQDCLEGDLLSKPESETPEVTPGGGCGCATSPAGPTPTLLLLLLPLALRRRG